MFDVVLYSKIISDWIIGRNVQEGIDIVYNNASFINEEVMRLLSLPDENVTQSDLDNMNFILTMSNILYNNTVFKVSSLILNFFFFHLWT